MPRADGATTYVDSCHHPEPARYHVRSARRIAKTLPVGTHDSIPTCIPMTRADDWFPTDLGRAPTRNGSSQPAAEACARAPGVMPVDRWVGLVQDRAHQEHNGRATWLRGTGLRTLSLSSRSRLHSTVRLASPPGRVPPTGSPAFRASPCGSRPGPAAGRLRCRL